MAIIEDIEEPLRNLVAFIPLTYITLFQVVNPIGSGLLFLNFTPNATDSLRRKMARKITVNMIIVLMITLLAGTYIMALFGITIPIVQVCGGLMIAAMGWKSLNSDDASHESDQKKIIKQEVTDDPGYMNQVFYPLTFPFTIGPGSIAATLTISAQSSSHHVSKYYVLGGGLVGVILISITVYMFYAYSNNVVSRMSKQTRKMLMKLLSFILVCIGGQIMYGGLEEIVKAFKAL